MRGKREANGRQASYVIRVQASLACSLLVLVLAVELWPVPKAADPRDIIHATREVEIVLLDDIVPTRQRRQPPPPPSPLPPVVVPDDRILEDDLDLEDIALVPEDPGAGLLPEPTPGDPSGDASSGIRAESAPKPVRIVEPEYPRAARRRNIRAEIILSVIVDRLGRVEDATIVERYILDEETREPVTELGYGLEESALSAASRWLFRPAQKDGQAVRSQHELSFKFGV